MPSVFAGVALHLCFLVPYWVREVGPAGGEMSSACLLEHNALLAPGLWCRGTVHLHVGLQIPSLCCLHAAIAWSIQSPRIGGWQR